MQIKMRNVDQFIFAVFLQHPINGCCTEIGLFGYQFNAVVIFVQKFSYDQDAIFKKSHFLAESIIE